MTPPPAGARPIPPPTRLKLKWRHAPPGQAFLPPTLAVLLALAAAAQSTPAQLTPIVKQKLESPAVVEFQLQQYLLRHAPRLPAAPASIAAWRAEAAKLRQRAFHIIYRGWPRGWLAPERAFIPRGTIHMPGYDIEKFRYPIVPGFYTTALLYQPTPLPAQAPAVLVAMGHFPYGKAEEFNQKLCINLVLRGMIVLNPEWIDQGESRAYGNGHFFGAQLDLAGYSGLGLFYLAMRRGLDFLESDRGVDRRRIGMTGVSGGGWQTIMLSALAGPNEIRAAVPVAGFTSFAGRVERQPGEPGDFEQNESDFLAPAPGLPGGLDYSTLAALRAPAPTLVVDNAEDDCCFRAPLVKPEIYTPVLPFFRLFGKPARYRFYQSTLISAHNYGREDRQQAYAFFDRYFGIHASDAEIPAGPKILSYRQLAAGLPKDNLTMLALAQRLAGRIHRPPAPAGAARAQWLAVERGKLRHLLRYRRTRVARAWRVANTWHNQLESLSYRFQMSNGLSAAGIWLQSVNTPADAPLDILLDDRGLAGNAPRRWDQIPLAAHLIDRGRQVLLLDLLFVGNSAPGSRANRVHFAELLEAIGRRPAGLEAAQLLAVARWARKQWHPARIELDTRGLRSQFVGLAAAALQPRTFAAVAVRAGLSRLAAVFTRPVKFEDAPELFCFGCYQEFGLKRLARLAAPAKVRERSPKDGH